jgi:hypothetical protein
MTRASVFTLIGLLFSAAVHSQVVKIEQDTIGLLCHKWQVTKFASQGKTVAVSGNTMEFRADGTGSFADDYSKKEHQESWTYDHAKRSLFVDRNLDLKQIAPDKLVLYDSAEKMTIYLKRLN